MLDPTPAISSKIIENIKATKGGTKIFSIHTLVTLQRNMPSKNGYYEVYATAEYDAFVFGPDVLMYLTDQALQDGQSIDFSR